MRHPARSALAVLPVLAVLACGGQVGLLGGHDGDGGACPAPSSITQGGSCDTPSDVSCNSDIPVYGCSGVVGDEGCSCVNGTWLCTVSTPVCPVDASAGCPSAIQPGEACDLATESACAVPYTYDSCGTTRTTTCSCGAAGSGAVWSCDEEPTPVCSNDGGPSACPVPSSIADGGPCDVPQSLSCKSDIPILDCNGNVVGNEPCQCFGYSWTCEAPGPFCPSDASTACPDPTTIVPGGACTGAGQVCPGNPTICDGATEYDAFECEEGQWVDTAQTTCSSDGGVPKGQ